jgi:uncharacterized damage-inducible protein DinB
MAHAEVPDMIALLRDLMQHKAHANAALLAAVARHDAAARDDQLRVLLHHILLANRFWVLTCLGQPFAAEEESRVPDSIDELAARCRATDAREAQWLGQATEDDLARAVESPLIPAKRYTVAEALMQVCLHSHGHRSQCAARLRAMGGTPPAADFILWLEDRPAADWSWHGSESR